VVSGAPNLQPLRKDVPTYEYRCPKGHEFEHFVLRISEAQSAMRCPTCGETAERRISAGGGLLFKGSGFYITDYGKDGKKDQRTNAPSSSTSASDGSASSSSGSSTSSDAKPATESKPAAKTESKPAPSTPSSKPDA
jgi:putative FmdB family regulatory protein